MSLIRITPVGVPRVSAARADSNVQSALLAFRNSVRAVRDSAYDHRRVSTVVRSTTINVIEEFRYENSIRQNQLSLDMQALATMAPVTLDKSSGPYAARIRVTPVRPYVIEDDFEQLAIPRGCGCGCEDDE
ncbi:MAG: hypothetical protein AB7V18_19595 [Pyrinomonadaceae bacterium]